MTDLFDEASALLFMKIGMHAHEDLATIIARKQKEIEDAGFAMWGYGGNTCHPTTMVQPFAQAHRSSGKPIVLAMHRMNSNHLAEPLRAEEFSTNGTDWQPVPEAINVLGSRYALCIKNLAEVSKSLPLAATHVAIGNSRGRTGDAYVKGRVDKACLEFADSLTGDAGEDAVSIELVADLVEPYAVFLRG